MKKGKFQFYKAHFTDKVSTKALSDLQKTGVLIPSDKPILLSTTSQSQWASFSFHAA